MRVLLQVEPLMDPASASATLATLVGLAADFVAQRTASKGASIEEFNKYLSEQRHEEIVKLLGSSIVTSVSIKDLLNEYHSEILGQFEQVKSQLNQSERLSQQQVEVSTCAVEKIILGRNNSYVGSDNDLNDLALRCAIYAINDERVEFEIELQKTLLDKTPENPLHLPQYEKVRLDRAQLLKKRLELLTSQEVYKWWRHFIYQKEDWLSVIKTLIKLADFSTNNFDTGHKIDVWRTEYPKLIAPIYLSEQEVAEMLKHLGFQSTSELRFGAHWRSVMDLPVDLIKNKVIPAVIVSLEDSEKAASGDVLNLGAWHIGEG